jgi:hypothetical protein
MFPGEKLDKRREKQFLNRILHETADSRHDEGWSNFSDIWVLLTV